MRTFKKQLEEMFSEEKKIGIVDRDYRTGETEEEFNMADQHEEFDKAGVYVGGLNSGDKKREFEGQACLPNGDCLFICTNGAKYVVEKLGEGAVYGFYVKDNPSVTNDEIISVEGHDFAVIRGRFIVDLWVKHMAGISEKVVFDLWDKKDFEEIKDLYGEPSKWCCNDLLNKKYYEFPDVPGQLKVTLGKPKPAVEYSMQ